MDRTVVIYKSKYGATKQYAQWIAEELQCDIIRAEDFKKKDFEKYDNIIFGGGMHGGGIKGLELIKKNKLRLEGKKIVIFAVGLNVDNSAARIEIRDLNLEKDWERGLTVYYCMGAFDPSKVTGIDKMEIRISLDMLESSRAEWTDELARLYHDMTNGADHIDRKYIEPIVAEFKCS